MSRSKKDASQPATPDPAPEQPQEQPATPDPAPEQPARRHAPDAGVKEYGISLDEISRRSRAGR